MFDPAYEGNPLVNAMCVGLMREDELITAKAEGIGNPILAVGARTGRDGIHGASFASEDLSEENEAKRPRVQVGDPFTEKLLLEASLELIRSGHIVAIQDMGAAGLTSSSAEMAERGDVGVVIDVTKVPVREEGMTPYEILLSESQERMLVVAKRGHEEQAKAILRKWDLQAEVIGEVIAEPVYRVVEGDRVVAEFPGSRLVTECPQYSPEAKESEAIIALRARDPHAVAERSEESDPTWTLVQLLSSPTIANKKWIYRQYDSQVRTSTVVGPGGADAAVVRLRGTDKALALKTDCNSRYVYLDPRMGGRIAVAEAARNVACTGGRPMAITNCLNFGNPKKPEVFFQFREAVTGMGEACRTLGTPVTGGNVSLYNENPQGAVFPTPTIGMVGLIESTAHITRSAFSTAGDAIVQLGEGSNELGASEYLARVHGLTIGAVPVVDLDHEKRLIDTLLDAISAGLVHSAHDVSEGGLAVSLAECCMGNESTRFGADVTMTASDNASDRAIFWGEAQGRVIISTPDPEAAIALAHANGVPARMIGSVTADPRMVIRTPARTLDSSLDILADAYFNAIPALMQRAATATA
jgi:phosphoribosylformylglycinamidine synthase subunit PurL